ncbi:MAG: ammonia channel protein, partial [Candidatus Dadabacteria bacterium]|nr:ammonia channel protein [Candidatus Dadabacteria bacterium]
MIDKALKGIFLPFLTILFFIPGTAFAQEGLDTGNSTWIMISTALVLFMMIPGLALFYGGLVARKKVLSILLQCFAITAVVTLIWTIVGYSLT